MNNESKLGLIVKKLRMAAGLTQVQLADAVGITERTVSRIEQGHVDTSLNTLSMIAEKLGVPLWRLFQYSGSEDDADAARFETIAALIARLAAFTDRELSFVIDLAELIEKHRDESAARTVETR